MAWLFTVLMVAWEASLPKPFLGSCSCINKGCNDRHVTGAPNGMGYLLRPQRLGQSRLWWAIGTRYHFLTE